MIVIFTPLTKWFKCALSLENRAIKPYSKKTPGLPASCLTPFPKILLRSRKMLLPGYRASRKLENGCQVGSWARLLKAGNKAERSGVSGLKAVLKLTFQTKCAKDITEVTQVVL